MMSIHNNLTRILAFLKARIFLSTYRRVEGAARRQPCGAGGMSLPRLWPPAVHPRHGGYRPFRLFCLRRLGLYGNSACAVARRTGTPGGLPETSSPLATRITSSPAATEASQ